MRRRDIIAAGTVIAAAGVASAAQARSEAPKDEGAPILNIAGIGLPVIADGKLRNYVFISLKLTLSGTQTPEALRPKDPYFRDALVRTAHRVPFTVDDDWTRIDEARVNAAMLGIAEVVAGKGAVVKSEVTQQAARRRTGVRGA